MDFKADRNEFSGLQQLGPDPSMGAHGHRGFSPTPNNLVSRWLVLPTRSPGFCQGLYAVSRVFVGKSLPVRFSLP